MTATRCACPVPVDEEHFPDPAFRKIVKHYWAEGGVLFKDAACAVREMHMLELADRMQPVDTPGEWVDMPADLHGIEYFACLEDLNAYGCDLVELDVSANKRLRRISCGGMNLRRLTIGDNVSLLELDCSYSSVTELDLSGCRNLRRLDCGSSPIARLDVSVSSALEVLLCADTSLEVLKMHPSAAPRVVDLRRTMLGPSLSPALAQMQCLAKEYEESGVSGGFGQPRLSDNASWFLFDAVGSVLPNHVRLRTAFDIGQLSGTEHFELPDLSRRACAACGLEHQSLWHCMADIALRWMEFSVGQLDSLRNAVCSFSTVAWCAGYTLTEIADFLNCRSSELYCAIVDSPGSTLPRLPNRYPPLNGRLGAGTLERCRIIAASYQSKLSVDEACSLISCLHKVQRFYGIGEPPECADGAGSNMRKQAVAMAAHLLHSCLHVPENTIAAIFAVSENRVAAALEDARHLYCEDSGFALAKAALESLVTSKGEYEYRRSAA